MLGTVNKVAAYVAAALLGYLAYSATDVSALGVAQEKEGPMVTAKMLRPEFVAPQQHASPPDRDPFNVPWANGASPSTAEPAAEGDPQAAPSAPADAQAAAATPPEPPPPEPPPKLPARLSSICLSDGLRLAVIDGKLYLPGGLVNGNDPARCWTVESIEGQGVVLRFGDVRQRLSLAAPAEGHQGPPNAKGKSDQ